MNFTTKSIPLSFSRVKVEYLNFMGRLLRQTITGKDYRNSLQPQIRLLNRIIPTIIAIKLLF